MNIPKGPEGLCPVWLDTALGVSSRFVKFTTQRVGADYGLDSRTYRIDVIRALARTTSFAVKLCDAATASHEGRMYSDVLPMTELPLARFVGAQDDGERGYVLLEYVRDGTQGDVLAGCPRDVGESLARALAALHAPWWEGHEELPPWLAEPRAPKPLDGERVDRCLARHGDRLDAAGRARMEGLPERLGALHSELDAHPATLVHGDFHMDNVMFDASGRPRILDWASARRGRAATDVARLLVECLQPAQRREYGADLVELYLDELRGQGVEGYGSTELGRGVALAQEILLAGAVGWAGAPEEPAADSRTAALQRNVLDNLLAALADG